MTPLLSALLFLLFLTSGFCGLLYQVVWVRLAFASYGVITPVLSVVISVFMAGLALGSWTAGRWVGPWTRHTGCSASLIYGAAEIGIGIGAFAVPVLLRQGEILLRPMGEMGSTAYLLLSALLIAAALLPWCFFMGTTFPLMAAFIGEREPDRASSFSFLYLGNVLGALNGVLATALVLIESWGFERTLLLAGSLNFSVGIVGSCLALLGRPNRRAGKEMPTLAPKAAEANVAALPFSRASALAILFGTGFLSMAMEVIWTRTYTPILSTTIYAFASLLATYLAATAVGTLAYRLGLRRGWRPGYDSIMALLAASAALPLLLPDPNVLPTPAVALGSIVPISALLGYVTPRVIDEYSRGAPLGVGGAYAWNILGSILGPLCAAYLLLPFLGAKVSQVLLAAPFLGFWVLVSRSTALRSRSALAAGVATLLLIYASARSTTFEDGSLYPNALVRRDYAATVISTRDGGRERLLVNGVGITHKTSITKMMAHLPMAFLDGSPEHSLVICFGMGTTLRSLVSWEQRVTAVELVPSVVKAFSYFYDDAEDIVAHEDVEIVIDDGRRFLQRTPTRFDVITIDPPPPVETAGSSLLYSVEFYELVRKRLAPGGILQQWFPGRRKQRPVSLEAAAGALAKAFPYVRVFRSHEGWGYHFLASNEQLPDLSAHELIDRLPGPARADLEEWLPESEVPDLFSETLANEIPIQRVLRGPTPRLWISDDHPVNEYFLLRRLR